MTRPRRHSATGDHSLSLVLGALLALLLLLYRDSDPNSHLGTFFGNAIGDWLGVLAFVIATKYFFEAGSAESRTPPRHLHARVSRVVQQHSLPIVLAITGVLWGVAYAEVDVNSKWGAVVGNIFSDWTQVLGLVLITKYAREAGSKEG